MPFFKKKTAHPKKIGNQDFLKAKEHFKGKKYALALPLFKSYLKTCNNPITYYWIALTYEELKEKSKALQFYNQSIKNNTKHIMSFLKRGLLYTQLGDYEEAIFDFNQVIALDDNPDGSHYISRAFVYELFNKPDLAKNDYITILKLKPHTSIIEYHKNSAESFARYDFYAALKYCHIALYIFYNKDHKYIKENRRQIIDLLQIKAMSYYHIENYDIANNTFSELIKKVENEPIFYWYRGHSRYCLSNFKQSRSDFKKVLENKERLTHEKRKECLVSTYINLGKICQNYFEYADAIGHFTQAINIDKKRAPAYYSRGWNYFSLEQYENAIKDFYQVRNLERSVNGYYKLSEALMLVERWQEAIDVLTEAISNYPDEAGFYNNRARCKATSDTFTPESEFSSALSALDDCDKAISLNPQGNEGKIYFTRANICHAIGNFQQAHADYASAIHYDCRFQGDLYKMLADEIITINVLVAKDKAGLNPKNPSGKLTDNYKNLLAFIKKAYSFNSILKGVIYLAYNILYNQIFMDGNTRTAIFTLQSLLLQFNNKLINRNVDEVYGKLSAIYEEIGGDIEKAIDILVNWVNGPIEPKGKKHYVKSKDPLEDLHTLYVKINSLPEILEQFEELEKTKIDLISQTKWQDFINKRYPRSFRKKLNKFRHASALDENKNEIESSEDDFPFDSLFKNQRLHIENLKNRLIKLLADMDISIKFFNGLAIVKFKKIDYSNNKFFHHDEGILLLRELLSNYGINKIDFNKYDKYKIEISYGLDKESEIKSVFENIAKSKNSLYAIINDRLVTTPLFGKNDPGISPKVAKEIFRFIGRNSTAIPLVSKAWRYLYFKTYIVKDINEINANNKELVPNNFPNFSTVIHKLLDAIGKENDDSKQLDDIPITRGEVGHSVSNEENYYTADFINLLLHNFNLGALPIQIYPAMDADRVQDYLEGINSSKEDFHFIPLNVAYDEKEPQHKNHWAAFIIDKKHRLIFYLDPAIKQVVPVQVETLKIALGYQDEMIRNPINFQQQEKEEGYIRHCGVYMVEIFKAFRQYIQQKQCISGSHLANETIEKNSVSLLQALSSIPCGEGEFVSKIRQGHIKDACKILGVDLGNSSEIQDTPFELFESSGSYLEHLPKESAKPIIK